MQPANCFSGTANRRTRHRSLQRQNAPLRARFVDTVTDGKLIVLSERGELMVADSTPAAFKPISRPQVLGGKCWTTPVLANGKIYCRNARGDLVCVDVSGRTN